MPLVLALLLASVFLLFSFFRLADPDGIYFVDKARTWVEVDHLPQNLVLKLEKTCSIAASMLKTLAENKTVRNWTEVIRTVEATLELLPPGAPQHQALEMLRDFNDVFQLFLDAEVRCAQSAKSFCSA